MASLEMWKFKILLTDRLDHEKKTIWSTFSPLIAVNKNNNRIVKLNSRAA